MSASSRTRLAVAAAALSVALVGCMTGTAITFEDPDGSLPHRPAAARSSPTAPSSPTARSSPTAEPGSGSGYVTPQTTPRTSARS